MDLRDILLHMDNSERADERLDIAIRLASQHEAHLIGLNVQNTLDNVALALATPYGGAALPQEILDRDAAEAEKAAAEAKATFEAAVAAAGVSAEWRGYTGLPGEVVGLNARYADLTIVGQTSPEDASTAVDDLAEQVVMTAGRPLSMATPAYMPDPWA